MPIILGIFINIQSYAKYYSCHGASKQLKKGNDKRKQINYVAEREDSQDMQGNIC